MEKTFGTLSELQAEIDLLKVRSFQQEEDLKDTLSNPSAIIATIKNSFKSGKGSKTLTSELLSSDIISNIARFAIPLFMNGVVFKRSGFITKTLITFLSQKMAGKVNSHSVSGIIDKIKGMFKHKSRGISNFTVKSAPRRPLDYGIPPDSESY